MARYKLLVGQHIQADPKAPDLTPEQVKAGAKKPSRVYNQGDTVVSDEDLVAKHGAAKFSFLDGSPEKAKATAGASVAPSGQVSSGFQTTTGTPEGGSVSGLADESEVTAKAPEDADEDDSDSEVENVNLSSLTIAQLKALAHDKGILLHGANNRTEIIKAIEAHGEGD